MKIVWGQDLDFFQFDGGAERTDRTYFREGLKRGHDLWLVTPQTQSVLDKDDIIILSNIRGFNREQVLGIPSRVVTFTHDWWCKYRLYIPLSVKCFSDCPEHSYWSKIYEKAELNIFLSPLHYTIHKERFGEAVEPHFLTPSGFDNVDAFFDMMKERKGYCNINGLLPFKGREQLVKFAKENPDIQIDVGGSSTENGRKLDEDLPENMKYVGPVHESQLNEFYNKHEFYIELPDTPQPYNRTVAEAYLSGCKIKGNALLGALSWGFTDRDSVRKHLREAPKVFWETLERELKL